MSARGRCGPPDCHVPSADKQPLCADTICKDRNQQTNHQDHSPFFLSPQQEKTGDPLVVWERNCGLGLMACCVVSMHIVPVVALVVDFFLTKRKGMMVELVFITTFVEERLHLGNPSGGNCDRVACISNG